jgi:hypothetical protein
MRGLAVLHEPAFTGVPAVTERTGQTGQHPASQPC